MNKISDSSESANALAGRIFRTTTALLAVVVASALMTGCSSSAPSKEASTTPSKYGESPTKVNEFSYAVGSCLIWNQDDPNGTKTTIKKVDCAEPHYFEYVSSYKLQRDGAFPNKDECETITDTDCAQSVTDYLGYKLWTRGAFGYSSVTPTADSWTKGDRDVHCGIEANGFLRPHAAPEEKWHMREFTGVVKGQDQTLLLPVGYCYNEGESGGFVECSESHESEIVGWVDVSKAKTNPNSDTMWNLTNADCLRLAKQYAGGSIPKDYISSGNLIPQQEWDEGRRKTECAARKWSYSSNSAIKVTGSLKH